MMTFLSAFTQALQTAWQTHYLPLMLVAIMLALVLRKAARNMPAYTLHMLLAFIVLLIGSAVAAGVNADSVAKALHGLAVLMLGMLLIRQVGLIFFRLIIPKLGLHPPRILEEIIILLAYGGWILVHLSAAGLNLSSLVASTAIITAVLALAMQDTLGNILSGLALQLDHSVNIGDWIELEDISGEVIQVQWRHTAVRTLFGEMVLIPNSQLMKARVMLTGGRSAPQRLRMVHFYGDFQVRSSEIIAVVEHAVQHIESPAIAPNPAPSCLIDNFRDGVVTYVCRYWLTDPTRPGVTDALVRQHIHAAFQRQGWLMAAPGRSVKVVPRRYHDPLPTALKQPDLAQRLHTLRSISLLDPLTDDEIQSLAQQLKVVHYVANSRLTQQGDRGDCLFVVIRGQAKVWLEAQGVRHLLAEVGPGEVIGEMSLMTGEPRRATVTTATDMDCYMLDKAGFQATLQQRPELADIFAQLLSARSQELNTLRDNMPTPAVAAQKADILARIRGLFLE